METYNEVVLDDQDISQTRLINELCQLPASNVKDPTQILTIILVVDSAFNQFMK